MKGIPLLGVATAVALVFAFALWVNTSPTPQLKSQRATSLNATIHPSQSYLMEHSTQHPKPTRGNKNITETLHISESPAPTDLPKTHDPKSQTGQLDKAGRVGTTKCRSTWFAPREHPVWSVAHHVQARTGCPQRQRIVCEGERLRRALVIYELHTRDSTQQMDPEITNFQYFRKHGFFGPTESTEMFEGVDYVLTRTVPRSRAGGAVPTVSVCSEQNNVKVLWLPSSPCDACGHHRVIEFLGGATIVAEKYSYVVFLDARVRGPFQHAEDPAWIDVFAMSGHSEWTPESRAVLTGPSVSCEQHIHVQSYAVGLSTQILPFMDRYFTKSCELAPGQCSSVGELVVSREALESSVAHLHALSRNVSLTSMVDTRVFCDMYHRYNPVHANPVQSEMDVCAAVFVVVGSTAPREAETVTSQVSQLISNGNGGSTPTDSVFGCPFLAL